MSLCSQCNTNLPTKFVKCFACNSQYHFSACCPLSEKTYSTMNTERKAEWRCHKCKPRKGSTGSNNAYHIVIDDCSAQANQKQQRDEENENNNDFKRFKDSLSLNDVNSSVVMVKADVRELKTDISEIKRTIQELAITITQNNTQMNTSLQTALSTLTSSITALTNQVSELCESNKEKEKQILDMDNRINNLEQKLLSKNIEIKNVTNKNISPNDVVKTIANSLNVEITDNDISNSYILKRSEKVIVEFSSLNKKTELLSKIDRHRVDASLINNENKNKFIYINEHLTLHKRRLLWLAKTKAKELNWKFVWVRNGNIYVKKNEASNPILINNSADIELITSAI